jgi:hypothetical protein
MKVVPYASAIGSIIYAQVCTRSDLAFVTGMFGKYQKNPSKCRWERIKKALRYLLCIKGLILTHKKSNVPLEIVDYPDSDFTGCLDTEKSTSRYIYTHTQKRSYIVKKLQKGCHYIFNDVRVVCWACNMV